MEWEIPIDSKIYLYADCFPVRGATHSAIYDLTRGEIFTFESAYLDVVSILERKTIRSVIECASEKTRQFVLDFILFLTRNELAYYGPAQFSFPKINLAAESTTKITNALIDCDGVMHDFLDIFRQLDALGCEFVQIRCFSDLLTIRNIAPIIALAHDTSIRSVEVIIKFIADVHEDLYADLLRREPILSSLIVHTAPVSKPIRVDDAEAVSTTAEALSKGRPAGRFTVQKLSSHHDCGVISIKSLTAPSVPSVTQNCSGNGCLKGKIGIDAFGAIRNCPSLSESYGNIGDTSLEVAISADTFPILGQIKKDEVAVCRDCEFRYACSDCRAYREDPRNLFSKPLKCGYNPYTAEWQDWSGNPVKQRVFREYLPNEMKK